MRPILPTSDVAVRYDLFGATSWITGCNPPVNALSSHVRAGMLGGIDDAARDPNVESIVLRCEGRTFYCGADLAELDSGIEQPELIDVLRACEATPKPVIGLLHGSVFGGGVVVAYGCDYRIADPQTRFAMPEIGLGLLPTYGGTQYLPRLIGTASALDLIIDGRHLNATEALDLGLIDEIVPKADQEARAIRLAFSGVPKRRTRERPLLPDAVAYEQRMRASQRSSPGFAAPQACLALMQRDLGMPLDVALEREHIAFLELVRSAQSRRLRMLFFAERRLAKGGFDRTTAEGLLRCAGPVPDALVSVARSLVSDHVVPSMEIVEALIVSVFELPRYEPSLLAGEVATA